MQELHGVSCAALGRGAQISGVTEHFGQRHFSVHDFTHTDTVFHPVNDAAATVEVTHHITHVFLGSDHFHLHHRLKQYCPALLRQFLGCHGRGNFKGHLVRVNIVERTIVQSGLQSQQRITRQNTILHLLGNTFFSRWNVLFWYSAANDFVDVFQAVGILVLTRSKANPNVTVLTATTGLTHKLTFDFAGILNALTVGDLWLTDIGVDLELSAHTLNENIQVQLTNTREDRKSTRLNSSHVAISYAVFCLKKKNRRTDEGG